VIPEHLHVRFPIGPGVLGQIPLELGGPVSGSGHGLFEAIVREVPIPQEASHLLSEGEDLRDDIGIVEVYFITGS
jgi:hypothetical protein